LLNEAREQGLVCAPGDTAKGLASLAVVLAQGPDAARFLHAQLTNEVQGLAVGAGNLNAKVSRTGHLESVFSLHRVQEDVFFLVGESEQAPALLAGLDGFLFADRVELSILKGEWLHFQGGASCELMPALEKEFDIRPTGKAWVIRRSLTGDPGCLVFGDFSAPEWLAAAKEKGLKEVPTEGYSPALEILRMEAGVLRIGPDLGERQHLLPETGLEHHAVSYSKGCYLGQEVIARVRTYGSVPRALRAVLVEQELSAVPDPGAPILNSEGKKIGIWASRCISSVASGSLVYAFLNRANRTPGNVLNLEGFEGRPLNAKVALLPLYRAKNTQERIATLYDRAVRVYAEGEVDAALAQLSEILQLDPAYGDAYELIGVMLGKAGRFHEAIDFFRRLEEVAPDEPMVNTNLSVFYMKIGDKQTAEDQSGIATQKQFRQTKWKDKSTLEIAQAQAETARKGAERKLGMFARVLAIDSEDPVALFGCGTSHAVLEEWQPAADFFERAVEVNKQNSAAHLGLGKALEGLDQIPAAIAAYKAGMEVASRRGDLMPLREMEHRVLLLS
jgi:folate-binding protein YgfZ